MADEDRKYQSQWDGEQIDEAIAILRSGGIQESVRKAAASAAAAEESAKESGGKATEAAGSAAQALGYKNEADAAKLAARGYSNESRTYRDAAERAATNAAEDAAEETTERLEGTFEALAKTSESWAIGGTSTRPGEDTDNSAYYSRQSQASAALAQSIAETMTIPAAKDVYNVVLRDRTTGDNYALIVEAGRLVLLGVSDELDATATVNLIDNTTGASYALYVDGGTLGIEEV